jgi:hypothetical protein
MYHISVLLEHVDFLDRLNWLDIQLLKRRLQLLVVSAGGFMDLLRLSSRSAFATRQMSACISGAHIECIRREFVGRSIPCIVWLVLALRSADTELTNQSCCLPQQPGVSSASLDPSSRLECSLPKLTVTTDEVWFVERTNSTGCGQMGLGRCPSNYDWSSGRPWTTCSIFRPRFHYAL